MGKDALLAVVSYYNPAEDIVTVRTKSGKEYHVSCESTLNFITITSQGLLRLRGKQRDIYIDMNSIESFDFN